MDTNNIPNQNPAGANPNPVNPGPAGNPPPGNPLTSPFAPGATPTPPAEPPDSQPPSVPTPPQVPPAAPVTPPPSAPATAPGNTPPAAAPTQPAPPQAGTPGQPVQISSEPNFGVGKPNIGVELEETQAPQQAPLPQPPSNDVQVPIQTNSSVTIDAVGPSMRSDIPVNNYAASQNQTPQPPMKAPVSAKTIAALAVVALILGGIGGFYGFSRLSGIKTSADINASPSASPSQVATSTNGTKKYTSTKYGFSLKYRSTWFSSTSDPEADEIVLASNQNSLSGSGELTGYQVTISFQASSGKTLATWVEDNQTTSAEEKSAKKITVDGKTAYQQELTKNGPAVATYVMINDKVMILTYKAPSNKMGDGGSFYNDIINSIVLS